MGHLKAVHESLERRTVLALSFVMGSRTIECSISTSQAEDREVFLTKCSFEVLDGPRGDPVERNINGTLALQRAGGCFLRQETHWIAL